MANAMNVVAIEMVMTLEEAGDGVVSVLVTGLSFHPRCKGSYISLNDCMHEAKRSSSFHDGLIFSNRPLFPREKVWIKVVQEEHRWHGALRVGFTTLDPNMMNAASLPPFACPDLTAHSGFWAIGIPEECCQEGAELCFWVNRRGQAIFKEKMNSRSRVLFSGIPTKAPLWFVLDVYGRTKAVQLIKHHEEGIRKNLPKTVERISKSQQKVTPDFYPGTEYLTFFHEEDPICVICNDRLADTLLLPCRHCSFCEPCTMKVKNQNSLCPLCRRTIFYTRNIGEINPAHKLESCL
ncbi:E3 ubiquitin-protein ligase NEURL3 [Gastrophryne carolinensis]